MQDEVQCKFTKVQCNFIQNKSKNKKKQISDMAWEVLYLHLHPPTKKSISCPIKLTDQHRDFRRQIRDLPSNTV
jgi:hypothetical protein